MANIDDLLEKCGRQQLCLEDLEEGLSSDLMRVPGYSAVPVSRVFERTDDFEYHLLSPVTASLPGWPSCNKTARAYLKRIVPLKRIVCQARAVETSYGNNISANIDVSIMDLFNEMTEALRALESGLKTVNELIHDLQSEYNAVAGTVPTVEQLKQLRFEVRELAANLGLKDESGITGLVARKPYVFGTQPRRSKKA